MQTTRMFSLNNWIVLAAIFCLFGTTSVLFSNASESPKNGAQISINPLDSETLSKLLMSQLESDSSRDESLKEGQLKRKLIANVNKRLTEEFDQDQKQKYLKADKQKTALRKKWHKLVDELVDGEFSSDGYAPSKRSEQPRENSKKKRWLGENTEEAGKNIIIIMKKPLTPEEDGKSDNFNGHNIPIKSSMNTASLWETDNQRREEGISNRRPVNMAEHARKVLQDKFDIVKDTSFSSNNHLGLKGVPKMGSDEEY